MTPQEIEKREILNAACDKCVTNLRREKGIITPEQAAEECDFCVVASLIGCKRQTEIERKRIELMKECLFGGCDKPTPEKCAICGNNKIENQRRMGLPIKKGADGLKRIFVGIKKTDEKEK